VLAVLLGVSASARRVDAAPAAESDLSVLGQGVDLRLGEPKLTCVTASPELRIDSQGSLSASYGASFESLLRTTTGSLVGGFDVGLLSARAHVDYFSRVAHSERSTAYTIDFQSKLGDVLAIAPVLSVEGRAAAALPEAERFERCGDAFTSSLEVGARFLLSAVFQFANAEEFQRFVATVRVEALFGLVHSSRSFSEETQSFAETAQLQIVALQQGGRSEALTRLIGPSLEQRCPLAEVEHCLELFRQLLAYAARLPEQFATPYRLEDLAVLGARQTRYLDSEFDALLVPEHSLDAQAAEILRRLVRERTAELSQSARLDLVLAMPVAPERRERLSSLRAALSAHSSALDGAIRRCRAAASRQACSAAEADAGARRPALDSSDLNF